MKALIFDTGPVISLTLNNLLWLLEPLYEKFHGNFYITKSVYEELIDKPLSTKKYKFEALQVLPFITKGILKTIKDERITQIAQQLLDRANNTFKADGNWIKIVHSGEIETIATAIYLQSDTIVIDERTGRMLIEDPESIATTLSMKLHTKIEVNQVNLDYIKKELSGLKVIRSAELVSVAYKLGLLDRYLLQDEKKIIKDLDKAVLEGALWGIKLNGCSISRDEIYKVIKILT
ncbi:hypothetical protein HY636_04045 [Candidatus Woesearchaeota archaeon]|nr:hypothetical protein [Candidatus Woesearchaeota archaeon]